VCFHGGSESPVGCGEQGAVETRHPEQRDQVQADLLLLGGLAREPSSAVLTSATNNVESGTAASKPPSENPASRSLMYSQTVSDIP